MRDFHHQVSSGFVCGVCCQSRPTHSVVASLAMLPVQRMLRDNMRQACSSLFVNGGTFCQRPCMMDRTVAGCGSLFRDVEVCRSHRVSSRVGSEARHLLVLLRMCRCVRPNWSQNIRLACVRQGTGCSWSSFVTKARECRLQVPLVPSCSLRYGNVHGWISRRGAAGGSQGNGVQTQRGWRWPMCFVWIHEGAGWSALHWSRPRLSVISRCVLRSLGWRFLKVGAV